MSQHLGALIFVKISAAPVGLAGRPLRNMQIPTVRPEAGPFHSTYVYTSQISTARLNEASALGSGRAGEYSYAT